MSVFRDGVIAFFSAVGMTTVVWLLAGAVFHAGRPIIPGLLLVLPARGEAPALEADVRGTQLCEEYPSAQPSGGVWVCMAVCGGGPLVLGELARKGPTHPGRLFF